LNATVTGRYPDPKPLEEPPGTYIDLANFIPSEPIVNILDCIPHNITRTYVCLNGTMFAMAAASTLQSPSSAPAAKSS
jgi:hypothetical protein